MSAPVAAAANAGERRYTGRIAVIALAVMLGFVVLGYLFTLPATWLRSFGAEIAYRAEADPNPPLPDDTRQTLRREDVANRLICMASIPSFDWDKMIVVPSGQSLAAHPVLGAVTWAAGDLADTDQLLNRDDRYQLIALVSEGAVVAHELFYTFWGDLSALARPEGFTRSDAIFKAASRGGRYLLSVADGASPSECPPQEQVRR
ncbi:MAG: hypothetical protein FJX59_11135 [Alphaproteobacteria bacterium]|nr:hypothetical protein [Alphaproteobacteria bacterium]